VGSDPDAAAGPPLVPSTDHTERAKEKTLRISMTIRKAAYCLLVSAVVAGSVLMATAASAARPHAHAAAPQSTLVEQLAAARLASAKYANDLGRAKKDGYMIITRMIPNMGWHFMNPKVKGFDVRKPAILVYEKHGTSWTLGALEWVFTSKPAKPPLAGAKYGAFGAGCHYADGTYVPAASQDACAKTAPGTGAAFTFWHPDLITLHVWLWYPNPSGLYSSTNPLVSPFNHG
jgi:hypothetical protein